MKKILIFTGAGASAPLGLPTVTEFMNEIQRDAEVITQEVLEYLSDYKNDIEKILSTLEDFEKNNTITDFLLGKIFSEINISPKNNPGLIFGAENTTAPFAVKNSISNRKHLAKREINRIKKIVFRKLQKYETESAISLYSNLLREIKTSIPEASISLITTNYDLTLETAIENYGDDNWQEIGVSEFDFGFKTKHGRPIYSNDSDFDWNPDIVEYLKIHGSLDWHRDSKSQCTRSMSNTMPEDPDQMVILYPGFKGVPIKEPFISLHNKLSARLQQADMVFVIGFAFRDQYINNIFESTLRTRPELRINYINPSEIKDLPDDSYTPALLKYKNFNHIKERLEISDSPLNIKNYIK